MDPLAANPLPYLMRVSWRNAKNYKKQILLYIGLAIAAMAVNSAEPLVIGHLFNLLQEAQSLRPVLMLTVGYICFFGALRFIFWMLHGPSRVIERTVAYQIRINYQIHLFQMITNLPLQWHKDHHSGELIENVNRASSALNDFIGSSFEIIHIITRFVSSVIILCFFIPYAGLAVLVATLITIVITILFDQILFKQDQALNLLTQKVAAAVHDYLTNIMTVISLRLERRAEDEVLRRVKTALPTLHDNIRLNEIKWFVNEVLVTTVIVGTLLMYIYKSAAIDVAFKAGTFFTLFEYLRRIGDGFHGFAWKYSQIAIQASRLHSADLIIEDYNRMVPKAAPADLPKHWSQLEIQHLNFSYPGKGEHELEFKNLNLTLKNQNSIAFVGESGSGKSTLLGLLRMLRIPESAVVICDGQVLPFGLQHVSHTTTLIPQEPEIFANTIRFNVSMGMEASEEEILNALTLARFMPVLKKLPRGLDTDISEKGINLSGGEKQRLALARGLFFGRDSDIILLDEATSSVDTANEHVIYQTLFSMFRNRCLIAVIHKLHLLPQFDLIYVFSHGKIVESGSYDELMSRAEGELSRLVRFHQLSVSEIQDRNAQYRDLQS